MLGLGVLLILAVNCPSPALVRGPFSRRDRQLVSIERLNDGFLMRAQYIGQAATKQIPAGHAASQIFTIPAYVLKRGFQILCAHPLGFINDNDFARSSPMTSGSHHFDN